MLHMVLRYFFCHLFTIFRFLFVYFSVLLNSYTHSWQNARYWLSTQGWRKASTRFLTLDHQQTYERWWVSLSLYGIHNMDSKAFSVAFDCTASVRQRIRVKKVKKKRKSSVTMMMVTRTRTRWATTVRPHTHGKFIYFIYFGCEFNGNVLKYKSDRMKRKKKHRKITKGRTEVPLTEVRKVRRLWKTALNRNLARIRRRKVEMGRNGYIKIYCWDVEHD